MAGINEYIDTRSVEYPAPNSAICAARSVEARIAYISAKKPMMTRTGAMNFFMAIELMSLLLFIMPKLLLYHSRLIDDLFLE